jgi:hypothetical protein
MEIDRGGGFIARKPAFLLAGKQAHKRHFIHPA